MSTLTEENRAILNLANLLEIYEFADEAEKWWNFFNFRPRKNNYNKRTSPHVINNIQEKTQKGEKINA